MKPRIKNFLPTLTENYISSSDKDFIEYVVYATLAEVMKEVGDKSKITKEELSVIVKRLKNTTVWRKGE